VASQAGFEPATRCLGERVAKGPTGKGFSGTDLVGNLPATTARRRIGF